MADAEDVRRLALALPEVEEIDSDGFDFRVGDEAENQVLPLGEPGTFFTTSSYDGYPLGAGVAARC
jgi:hypothetical protein